MLADFMQSATEEILIIENQAERTLVENAIRNTTVDLAMETIRKGSPHTLRLMKTQASYGASAQKLGTGCMVIA